MYSIVLPCYNESKGITTFLERLEAVLSTTNETFSLILVDDNSTDDTQTVLARYAPKYDKITLHVLKMKFNVGHQTAIYNGLRFALDTDTDHIIVMDSDGEDDPRAILPLLQKKEFDIVEVKRGRRSESWAFQIMYLCYKILFYFITGKSMNFGNFTMVKKNMLEQLRYDSFIHYPAYLLKQRGSRSYIKFDRSKRIEGKSKMSWHSLLIHSFKSMIEFGEQLLMLFLKLFVILCVVIFILIGNVLYKKAIGVAILGWTSTILIGLFTLAIVCLGFFVLGILFLQVINKRQVLQQGAIFIKTR